MEIAAPPWGNALLHAPLLKWWLPLFLVAAILAGFHRRASMSAGQRRAYLALLATTIVAFGGLLAARSRINIRTPPERDVQGFWLYGQVARSGRNFYEPRTFRAVHAALAARDPQVTTSEVFSREVLDVGFPYPAPTMLLFAPLGWVELRTAALAWYALHFLALGVAIACSGAPSCVRKERWVSRSPRRSC